MRKFAGFSFFFLLGVLFLLLLKYHKIKASIGAGDLNLSGEVDLGTIDVPASGAPLDPDLEII